MSSRRRSTGRGVLDPRLRLGEGLGGGRAGIDPPDDAVGERAGRLARALLDQRARAPRARSGRAAAARGQDPLDAEQREALIGA